MLKKFSHAYQRFRVSSSPQFNLVWGFFLYTIVGWGLLSLPIFHKAAVPLLDNLFTSASAISTTGLVTVGIADVYNLPGQVLIMLLFQIGGIGYMSLTTYYLLFTSKRITHWHNKVMGAAFTMPGSIKMTDFIKSVIYFTIVMETLGAICLGLAFASAGMATGEAIWYGVFHSVSAFCTAGFGLFSDSFEGYQNNVFVNVVISVLAISGSLGFIVITDLWYRLSGRSKSLSFTSKIIIYGFVLLLSVSTVLIYFTEPLVHQNGSSPIMKSFFQAMTAMTTVGFNTISTGAVSIPILLLVLFLMYIGASPSGTAGGMKITTLTALIAILKSRIFGEKKINFLNRTIPFERLYVATSTFILYTSLIFLFTFLLSFSEKEAPFEHILFETASALGTVGLSAGITGSLSTVGKVLLVVVMFIGRVGVLTFGFALLARKKPDSKDVLEEDLAV